MPGVCQATDGNVAAVPPRGFAANQRRTLACAAIGIGRHSEGFGFADGLFGTMIDGD